MQSRAMMIRALQLAAGVVLSLSSCTNEPSFGDRLVSEGNATKEQGERWNKGNRLVSEGEKQKKKGREMIEEGESLVRKGERNLERGEKLKASVEEAGR